MTALLELEDVEARYGPVHVLHKISLAVEEEQPWPARERAGELDALQGAVREAGRGPVRMLDDPDVGERLERNAALLALALEAGRGVCADEDDLDEDDVEWHGAHRLS